MNIAPASPNDYDTLMRIWASSVKASHHFLKEADFLWYQEIIADQFFPQVQLYLIKDAQEVPQGFLGTAGDMLEMLFIDAAARGKGYGKALLHFAIHTLAIKKVDVNEQNEEAVAFYLSQGFSVHARSAQDGMGKDYPILHLQRR
ncbi:GNAT family N-acetyltransferase [Taibaiella sp. KBW10]|uniref:GNAT family N-acetyltransferase n=1 Tax=Taibaiella sp. KBW10 TaxID=2153357 RepID=UPI000F5A0FBC|nr:GNAT family N-acetyltransferase [Taibaiella sp. KBW10]RQO30358.1 GNAT family N-acetyltransferase [Taibaiella sp. KBW10]